MRLPVLVLLAPILYGGPKPTDWPGFRGPNGSGVAAGVRLPASLDRDKNMIWRVPVGPGFSSPVLAGDRLYLTSFEKEKIFTQAYEAATGKLLWKQEAPRSKVTRRSVNTPSSSTPFADGDNVYAFFEDFGVISYDRDGKERWRYPYSNFNSPYGVSASPTLAGGKLLVVCDQDTDSFLMALDPKTGKLLYKVQRPESTHGFSSPVVYTPAKGPAQIILSGSYQVAGYDLETGEKMWWVWGMAWQAKSTPVIHNDILYVHSWMATMSELGAQKDDVPPFEEVLKEFDKDKDGKLSKEESPDPAMKPVWFLFDLNKDGFIDGKEWDVHRKRGAARSGLYAIKLGGKGDVTASNVLWKYEKSLPNIPSPVLYQDVIYVLKEGGILTSLDPVTGKV